MDSAGVIVFGSGVLAVVGSLILLVPVARLREVMSTVVTALLVLLSAAMLAYVFSAEGYTETGRTVWEDSNWPRRLIELGAILLSAGTAALAGRSRRRQHLNWSVPPATMLVVFIDYFALLLTVE